MTADTDMKLTAFVQAGGYSSRMGRDKSWVEIDGRPMIEFVLATARAVAGELNIIISNDNPHPARYRETAANRGAKLIFDLHDHKGPLGGIHTALRACGQHETALILACDLPFLTDEFLRLLTGIHFDEIGEGYDLTVPVDREGRVQMLCGLYSPACLLPVERMLSENILKVDRLCPEVKTRRVDFATFSHLPNAERLLTNLNSMPEYLATIEK